MFRQHGEYSQAFTTTPPSEPVRGVGMDAPTIRRSTSRRPRTGFFPMLAVGAAALTLGAISWGATINRAIDANPALLFFSLAMTAVAAFVWNQPEAADALALTLKRRAAGIRAAESARRAAEEAVTL